MKMSLQSAPEGLAVADSGTPEDWNLAPTTSCRQSTASLLQLMRMSHQLPSLEELQTFREVARKRSFSSAARELHVTPSAVSHRISELEESLGVALFARTTRSVRLTDAGRRLLSGVDAGLDQIHEAISAIYAPARGPAITVSCSTSFAILQLLPNLPHLKAEIPDLEVHVFADDRLADPRREDIDVCIRYGAGNYPGLQATRLGTEWVFPVCSPEFRHRHRLKEPKQLLCVPLIHHDVLRDHPGRVDFPRWLKRAGVSGRATTAGTHFSHAHMALAAAIGGQGVALGRTSLVGPALGAGHLVMPLRPKVRSGLAYHFVTAEPPKGSVARLLAWLRARLRAGGT